MGAPFCVRSLLLKGGGTEGDWGILCKLEVENVGADIIRLFKKRWFAEEHLIRHFVPPSPQGEG